MRPRREAPRWLMLAFLFLLTGCQMLVLVGCATIDQILGQQTNAKPVINSLSPASGKVGSQVTVNGANFGNMQGTIAFQDANQTFVNAPVSTWTDTVCVITVPVMPSGSQTCNVGMQTAAGQVPALPATFNVTAN
jgi:hypothetical protein